eukprot:CAMPEP_0118668056 /NCGR_PEP_ID=MMETSP0785-20121206/20137_1 /TAXON_ID=91992 /ORGANISM="Bolidomonas pacifica, Strain CCMP 1866" /LENGTH=243 /DNA_ID=CAMNT_0006562593 /DNA_START=29 /DNA_END=757 /DNA_ORIENTATION=-
MTKHKDFPILTSSTSSVLPLNISNDTVLSVPNTSSGDVMMPLMDGRFLLVGLRISNDSSGEHDIEISSSSIFLNAFLNHPTTSSSSASSTPPPPPPQTTLISIHPSHSTVTTTTTKSSTSEQSVTTFECVAVFCKSSPTNQGFGGDGKGNFERVETFKDYNGGVYRCGHFTSTTKGGQGVWNGSSGGYVMMPLSLTVKTSSEGGGAITVVEKRNWMISEIPNGTMFAGYHSGVVSFGVRGDVR